MCAGCGGPTENPRRDAKYPLGRQLENKGRKNRAIEMGVPLPARSSSIQSILFAQEYGGKAPRSLTANKGV